MKQAIIPILLTTVWISVSEFIRNQLLFVSYWEDHYASLGRAFPADPLNGIVWGVWSLALAVLIFSLMQKFSQKQAAVLTWFVGFFMMWLVIGNLGVLPYGLLWFAVPLSVVEVLVASMIVKRFMPTRR